jgi:hypothetical protein
MNPKVRGWLATITAMALIALLVWIFWFAPRHRPPATEAGPVTPPIKTVSSPALVTFEAPKAAPAVLSANPPAPASASWNVGAYMAGGAWHDVGTDSPQNALQTILWARKTKNSVRRMAISMTRQVNFNAGSNPDSTTGGLLSPSGLPKDEEVLATLLASSGLRGDNRTYIVLASANTPQLVDPSSLDYDKLAGARIISQTQISPNTVDIEVEEDWSEAQGRLGSKTVEHLEFMNTAIYDAASPAKEVAPATWLFTAISVHLVTDNEPGANP